MKKSFIIFCVLLVVVMQLLSSCKVHSNSYIKYREHPKYKVHY